MGISGRRALLIVVVLVGGGILVSVGFTADYSSTNFEVKNPVIEELGGFATSTSFQLWGAIPYISTRITSSTSFVLTPGFLSFPGTTSATTPTTTTPIGPGGGGGSPRRDEPREIPPEMCLKADFNQDGWIDFVDFSILLYYYDKTGSIIERYDLDGDDDINIVDISIFMYYWNGGRIKCEHAPTRA